MASSTPGYCTFTATARPSRVMARCTWPIDAAAIGTGSHSANTSVGIAAQLGPDHAGGQLGAHRRGVGLQLGQGVAHVLGQALVEVAGHLAELHERALHLAERLGHLLGRLQLEGGVEALAPLGVGEHAAGPVHGEGRAGPGAEAGQSGVAGPPAGVRQGAFAITQPAPGDVPPDRSAGGDPEHGGGSDRDPARHAATLRIRPSAEETAGTDPVRLRRGRYRYLAAVSDVVTWTTAATLLLGFGSGVLAGMFGIGGAVITTPSIRVLGATPIQAVGSTVPAILPGSISGAYRYWREGLVDWRVGLVCGGTGAVFAAGGAKLDDLIDGHYLMILTAALLAFSGVSIIRSADAPVREPLPVAGPEGDQAEAFAEPVTRDDRFRHPGVTGSATGDGRAVGVAVLAAVGAVAGLLAGLLGVGGGIVMMPAFTGLLRMPIKVAVGSSLVAVAMFSIPALVTHTRSATSRGGSPSRS